MSKWYQAPFSKFPLDGITRKVLSYLVQRYIGQFFEEKLTIDQLKINFGKDNGTGSIENVSLDVQAINELGEKQNWPIEFVDGYFEKLTLQVPWLCMLQKNSVVEVRGLNLTVQPKQRTENATSMFESMWSSMTSSMQMAQECINQDLPESECRRSFEGIEKFAQMIDSIMNRVIVKFINTTIQVEHVPKDSSNGVGIQIKIDFMQYADEAGQDPPTGEQQEEYVKEQKKDYITGSFSTKNIALEGVSFHTVEFPSKSRTFSRSVLEQSQVFTRSSSTTSDSPDESEAGDSEAASSHRYDECTQKDGRYVPPDHANCESDRHNILFAKLRGTQEIRLRMKQSETMTGPKVAIETNFGTLTVFLSSRQVYILTELATGLATPDLEDTSNVPPRHKATQKDLTAHDFKIIQQQLEKEMNPLPGNQMSALQGTSHGWSTSPLDDGDDNFLPMKGRSQMIDSTMSNLTGSMDSSLSASVMSSVSDFSTRVHRKKANIELDPTAEISHFEIRLASLSVILLHEDVITVSSEDMRRVLPSSVIQMKNMAKKFFEGHPYQNGYGLMDFDKISHLYNSMLPTSNHLRFLAAPIQIDAKETTTQTAFEVTGTLSARRFELVESVTNGQDELNIVKLLSFLNSKTSESSIYKETVSGDWKPNFVLHFKHREKTSKSYSRHVSPPKTDLEIHLDACVAEIDITIIDRLTALLNPVPVCVINSASENLRSLSSTTSLSQSDSKVGLMLSCPSITIKLRFPIPDYREPTDPNRIPWYKRSVRQDFLSLQFIDAMFLTTVQSTQNCQEYSVETRSLYIFYLENERVPALLVAKTESEQKYKSLEDGYPFPRMVLQIYPESDEVESKQPEVEADLMSQSIYGNLVNEYAKESSPFSSRTLLQINGTPQRKPRNDKPESSEEEVIIPGERQEMEDFIHGTTSNALVRLELNFPMVSVQFWNKHMYEVLYNRINTDLLLWKPSAPKFAYNYSSGSGYTKIKKLAESFSMCMNNLRQDSDDETEDDVVLSHIFYSTYDTQPKHFTKSQGECATASGSQSEFTLNVHIGFGIINMITPVRDLQSNVIPGQQGEFVLKIEDATIFSVNGYNGNNDLGFACIHVENAQMYHCDMRSTPCETPSLFEYNSILPRHLHHTIYKSGDGVLQAAFNHGGKRQMLSIAVKIEANHETHNVKTVTVALGLNKATLKHQMCLEPNTWISHLIDFFNVDDYTIAGYIPKEVLTEFHLHVWDCAIDYRPKFLPLRTVITVGHFAMSSHIAPTYKSLLRFIAEDCSLFISQMAPRRDGMPSSAIIDLEKEYVNVIELGVFQITLEINDKRSGQMPLLDLSASNNQINIRTCADTAKALMQLITYFASDGDFQQKGGDFGSAPNSAFSSPIHKPEQELVKVGLNTSQITKKQHEEVERMIAEAIAYTPPTKLGVQSKAKKSHACNIFRFPDEGNFCDLDDEEPTQSWRESVHPSNAFREIDDDFIIIGDEAALTITDRYPCIDWEIGSAFNAADARYNKSQSEGVRDLFDTPHDYPQAVTRYTLADASIVWHLYGGNDFNTKPDKKTNKKTVQFSDSTPSTSSNVAFSNTNSGEVTITTSKNSKQSTKRRLVSWTAKGGVNRDHDTLLQIHIKKIRFQHETFPLHMKKASRQIFIINEFEIRDRLEVSQINKFLCQYTTNAKPKLSHSPMLTLKAVHERPDTKLPTQHCDLKVTLLPLRLNIDQHTLLFLVDFCNELQVPPPELEVERPPPTKNTTPTHHPPIMTIASPSTSKSLSKSEKDLLILSQARDVSDEETPTPEHVPLEVGMDNSPTYFRKVTINPVAVVLDYQSKFIDLSHGPLAAFMGIASFTNVVITFKKISFQQGILSFEKLMNLCLEEWIEDIRKNQKSAVAMGLSAFDSVLKLGTGIWNLFWLPIEQYQKDGRIIKGFQRGANSFAKCTVMAALDITSRAINIIIIFAEILLDMLSSSNNQKRIKYNQPQDFREGVANAYTLIREGIGETAENLVKVATHEHEQKGYAGAVGGILRQLPPTLIAPIKLASEATNNIIGGVKCELAPDIKMEATEKWRKGRRDDSNF